MTTQVPPEMARPVHEDSSRFDFFSELYQEYWNELLYDPTHDVLATNALASQIEVWKDDMTTVFTSGVFDLMHLDHAGYLLHSKSLGAPVHYEDFYRTNGEPKWSELSRDRQEDLTRTMLKGDELKLVVSVDGDRSTAKRKGHNPDKGGSPRPIYSWETRSRDVAKLVLPMHVDGSFHGVQVVNAVTTHGPEDFDESSPHHDICGLAAYLQPDVWAIFGECDDILTEAPQRSDLGNVALRKIPLLEGVHYFTDRFLGKFSTTQIVKRASIPE